MSDYGIEISSAYEDFDLAPFEVGFNLFGDPADPYTALHKIVDKIQKHNFKATDAELREGFELVRIGLEKRPNFPGFYIGKGFLELVSHRLEDAIRSFKRANEIDKKFKDGYCQPGDAYFGLGVAYLMQERYSKAKEKLELAKDKGNKRAPAVIKEHLWWLVW